MQKRGQITIFIIIGIIILFVTGMIFWLNGRSVTQDIQNVETIPADTSSVQMYVEECLQSSLKKSAFFVASQGGYYDLPEKSTKDALVNVPYYVDAEAILVPSVSIVEKSIADGIDVYMNECIANFSSFTDKKIEASKFYYDVKLMGDSLTADLQTTIKVSEGNEESGKVSELNKFSTSIKLGIEKMREVALQIADENAGNEMICLSCVGILGIESGYNIDMIDDDVEGTFVIIEDVLSSNGDGYLQYRFGIRR